MERNGRLGTPGHIDWLSAEMRLERRRVSILCFTIQLMQWLEQSSTKLTRRNRENNNWRLSGTLGKLIGFQMRCAWCAPGWWVCWSSRPVTRTLVQIIWSWGPVPKYSMSPIYHGSLSPFFLFYFPSFSLRLSFLPFSSLFSSYSPSFWGLGLLSRVRMTVLAKTFTVVICIRNVRTLGLKLTSWIVSK